MSSDSVHGRRVAFDRALLRLTAGATLALLMIGCGADAGSPGPPPPGTLTIAHDHANGKTIRLAVGDQLELILSSSYWKLRGSSAPAVLRQDGPTKLLPRPSTCPDIPGIGCTPVRTMFTALAPGTVQITASRITCGEALLCRPDQRRFRVTVIVR